MRGLTVAAGLTMDGSFMHFPSLPSFSLLILLTLAATTTTRADDPVQTTPEPVAAEVTSPAPAAAPPSEDQIVKSEEDIAREKAIAEFTQRMKDYNYPELFDKAAKEFGVPADILKGIAFAETRWEHLQWPAGETVSPENGMPRPYGIMSLWDNEYFGQSLHEAARLIGKDPQELKDDAFQNMRGAAALLKKLYQETPKPADAQGDEIESWRKAIVKYCGIPQPELSEQHALEVYEWMNEGFHQYGIEWDDHPVKLDAMRAEVAKLKAEAVAKAEAREKEEEAREQAKLIPAVAKKSPSASTGNADGKSEVPVAVAASAPNAKPAWMIWAAILGILALISLVYLMTRPKSSSSKSR